jgi:hypothetical protein
MREITFDLAPGLNSSGEFLPRGARLNRDMSEAGLNWPWGQFVICDEARLIEILTILVKIVQRGLGEKLGENYTSNILTPCAEQTSLLRLCTTI